MRPSLSVSGLQAILIAVLGMTPMSAALASTTPSLDQSTSQGTDPASKMQASQPPLDVSARTVREAARASAEATNDSGVDRLPADQSKALKELQPTCSKLVALAELAAVIAICTTDHCGYTGSDTDRSSSPGSVGRRGPFPTCASKGVKLW